MINLQKVAIVPKENIDILIEGEAYTSIEDCLKNCSFDEVQEFDYAQTALLDIDNGYIIYWNDNIHCNPDLYIDAFITALDYAEVEYQIEQSIKLEDDFKNKKYNGKKYI